MIEKWVITSFMATGASLVIALAGLGLGLRIMVCVGLGAAVISGLSMFWLIMVDVWRHPHD